MPPFLPLGHTEPPRPADPPARTDSEARHGLLRWFRSRVSNGMLGAMNGPLQATKARTRGYPTTENLIAVAHLVSGKLDFRLPIKTARRRTLGGLRRGRSVPRPCGGDLPDPRSGEKPPDSRGTFPGMAHRFSWDDTLGWSPSGSVVVAIATYRRPEGLEKCLRHLAKQEGAGEEWKRDVIVVDNDPSGSAEATAHRVAREMELTLSYAVEPEPGISAARNRCIDLAGDHAFLAFLDDDEWPAVHWLSELLEAQRRHGGALVGGPVMRVPEGELPSWAEHIGFFSGPKARPTGPTNRHLGAGNLLIQLSLQERLGRLFSPAYGRSGGEDAELILRAEKANVTRVWAAEALVFEALPPERLTIRWVLSRSYRQGATAARMNLEHGIVRRRSVVAVRGARSFAAGVVRTVRSAAARDWPGALYSMREAVKALGSIAGSAGARPTAYR